MRQRIAVLMMLLALLLSACGKANSTEQTPVTLRTKLLGCDSCEFSLELTGDYGDYIQEFQMDCSAGQAGVTMTLIQPEIAAGIQASVSGNEAKVSFADTVLAVEQFKTRDISPMAAPGVLYEAWTSGYIASTGMDGETERVEYTLGYGLKELRITTWFRDGLPVRGEISDGNETLAFCNIENFSAA